MHEKVLYYLKSYVAQQWWGCALQILEIQLGGLP